jgi:hypothetical protein
MRFAGAFTDKSIACDISPRMTLPRVQPIIPISRKSRSTIPTGCEFNAMVSGRGLRRGGRCVGGCRLGFVDDSPLEEAGSEPSAPVYRELGGMQVGKKEPRLPRG